MNDAEKKALSMLSEEEKAEIVGGTEPIDENMELTTEQCNKLRKKWDNINLQYIHDPMLCKYGGPGMFKPEKPFKLPKDLKLPPITIRPHKHQKNDEE